MMKQTLTALLAALLAVFCLLPSATLAAEPEDGFSTESETVEIRLTGAPADMPSNRELFAGYVAGRFFAAAGYDSVSPLSALDSAGSRLEGLSRRLYTLLREKAREIARNGGSTAFTLTSEDLGLQTEWTAEDLTEADIGEIKDDATFAAACVAVMELQGIDDDAFNAASKEAQNALLADCPFELYWFDKTEGLGMERHTGYGFDGGVFTLNFRLEGTFSVAGDYQDPNSSTPAVTSGVGRVEDAARTAADIVALYAEESDYKKLAAYKDTICKLTSYNYEAAKGSVSYGYGDPWQLISVFDGNPETTVVCEGYSKAFQFLCDLSAFDDVDCYTVSGLMAGGTGDGGNGKAGPHMWNIVRIGEKNYLADITNSDEGSAGQDGGLFLAGTEMRDDSEPAGYVFQLENKQTITYWYDGNQEDVWGTETLELAGESYNPGSASTAPAAPLETAVSLPPVWQPGGTLEIQYAAAGPTHLLAAVYDGDGRLLDVRLQTCDEAGRFTLAFPLPAETASVRAMAAGRSGWAPLCEGVKA